MTAMTGYNDDLLLQAYCDGELDPAAALAFEHRMAADAGLKAQYSRLIALRGALQSLPLDDEPRYLQARIDKTLDGERPRQRNWSWMRLLLPRNQECCQNQSCG